MKTYLQMDGDRLVEYVEKREYDELLLLLASEKSTRNHLIKRGAELERELDDMKSQRADFGALVDNLERELNAAKQELQDAVKRMEDVTDADLVLAYWAGSHSTLVHEGANRVRTRLIQAAKGEQP